ncbi:MAG: exopolyphosphatase [Crocinitomicaceae bacterium]|nr:exopolyphosphatase [Crocinitomicaceae bacterium]
MNFAAIDIGTNAARLLIAHVQQIEGRIYFQKLAYYRVPLRLGEEVFDKGKISTQKALHFQQTIQAFSLLAAAHEVSAIRAVATSAMREASNGKKIAKQILQETGVDIDIISGDEEAQLIFNSFEILQLQKQQQFLVVDVGGGSTEISIFEHGQKVAARSFELGTIRILKGKTNPQSWPEFSDWIKQNVRLDEAHMIFGTGGNINRVLKMLAPKQKDTLTLASLIDLHNTLADLSVDERCAQYQLKPDRADVIVPALKIYITALEALGQQTLVVPKIGLSDGVIYQLYLQHTSI